VILVVYSSSYKTLYPMIWAISQRKWQCKRRCGADGGKGKKLCTEGRISSHMSYAEARTQSFHPSYAIIHDRNAVSSSAGNVKSYPKQVREDGKAIDQSHMDCHDIRFVERLRTVRTLSHTVGNTIFNTVVAEGMAARLDSGVLEVVPANGAESKSLAGLVKAKIGQIETYSKHFFLA
jgi:hypothetical protein